MGKEARLKRATWKRVTKGFVIENFKQQGCKACLGTGIVDNDKVCVCATLAFRRSGDEWIAEKRLRVNDAGDFEYRALGAV